METLNAVRTALSKLGVIIIDMNDHYLIKFVDDRSQSFGFIPEDLTEALIVGEALHEWRGKAPGKSLMVYYADMQRVKRGMELDAGRYATGVPNVVELHHEFFRNQSMYHATEKAPIE